MSGLYDLEIDLSSNDGGMSRDKFKSGMIVRLFGHNKQRRLSLPVLCGRVYFVNDGNEDVIVTRGGSVPVRIGRGSVVQLMLNGEPNWLRRVSA